jgi:aryl-alcohol dehydrogenase-like predicted oxidoreductase
VRTRQLGSSGPELSVIGFGAWEAGGDVWGPNQSDEHVVEAMRSGLDAGITWIDTAEIYGHGRSERLVGRAVAGRRDEVLIATKVAPRRSGTGFAAEDVARACASSLGRLGTDHIDLYQLHWPDRRIPVEWTWEAMVGLLEKGLVRAIGVSNFDRDLISKCLAIRHVDSLQQHFSMLHLANRDLIRWCGEQGIGVVTYGPLGYGLLSGAIGKDTTFPPGDWRAGAMSSSYEAMFAPGRIDRSLAVVDAMRPIAARLGVTVAQLALAWNVHQPGVTAAIAGSRNPDHVRENAGAGELELDDVTLKELEEILHLGPDF